MSPRICICCGEPIDERANERPENPNLCAGCVGAADSAEKASQPPGAAQKTPRRKPPDEPSIFWAIKPGALIGRTISVA